MAKKTDKLPPVIIPRSASVEKNPDGPCDLVRVSFTFDDRAMTVTYTDDGGDAIPIFHNEAYITASVAGIREIMRSVLDPYAKQHFTRVPKRPRF